jgi:L-aspartate oxidase
MTAPSVPQRLAAPEPGWTDTVDVVVIGSGVAGLTAALKARELGSVLVVTKDVVASGSTQWAQGRRPPPGGLARGAPAGHSRRRRRAE